MSRALVNPLSTPPRRARGAFIDRLGAAPMGGGFALDNEWVWCGSVIRGDDDRYHMFASVWSKALPFWPCWVTNSRVVRASADRPAGPYRLEETVLPARDAACWDGRMTHNPTIHRAPDGTFLLFYTGTTYDGPTPTPEQPGRWTEPQARQARAQQRIGLATAPSVFGPWTRHDAPILGPRDGCWDGLMTTNAAPCVLPDGSILLIYKSSAHQRDLLRLGVARAAGYDRPFDRLRDEPILTFDDTGDHVEDPYVWHDGGGFQMIMKDMAGGVCGERFGGIHATSTDGVHWRVADPPLAYSRRVRWDDGTITTQSHFERPQLLIEGGRPTHLFAATSDAADINHASITHSWNMVIPLRDASTSPIRTPTPVITQEV